MSELDLAYQAIWNNNVTAKEETGARALVMKGLPQFVELETTQKCNLDCLECPREPGPQGIDVPEWIVEKLGAIMPSLQNISLHGLGEPLMSKRTDEIVRRLSPLTHVWFSSNLQILTPRHLELFKDRAGVVSCSLDAATPETYALVRGADLARSIENIARVRDATKLRVFINMTLMKMNVGEVGRFLELGKSLGVDKVVFLRLNEGDSYEIVRDRGTFHFVYGEQHLSAEDARDVARQIEEHPAPFPVEDNINLKLHPGTAAAPPEAAADVRPADAPPLEVAPAKADAAGGEVSVVNPDKELLCSMPWTNLHVRIDGSVRVCCHHEAFANLEDRTVEEIWNGPELQAMRAAIGKGELHPLCQRENCPVYRDWRVKTTPSRALPARIGRALRRGLAPAAASGAARLLR
ncbi:MAG: radical SAM protein [Acidobacteriota bacterium]